MTADGLGLRRLLPAGAAYLVLWAAAVAYLALSGGDWVTPVLVLVIFGIVLSSIAYFLTMKSKTPAVEVARPQLESVWLLIYLVVYAVLFLGYGMTAARNAYPPGPAQETLVLGLKLLVHVILPFALLYVLAARPARLFQSSVTDPAFWRTLIVMALIFIGLSTVISPSLSEISATGASAATLAWIAPAAFIWLALEAGLTEEFLFRAAIQTRLAAWWKSPWVAIFATSTLFGIAHAPGLFMRGGPDVSGWSEDPFQVIAYTIGVLSPIGVLFGLMYARTRNLLLVVLLHASVDVLPNMAEFYKTWVARG